MTDKRDYTVPQVAKEFSCSAGTVKNWIKAGRVKAYRLGGPAGRDYRIPWAEVERLKSEWLFSPDTEQRPSNDGPYAPSKFACTTCGDLNCTEHP